MSNPTQQTSNNKKSTKQITINYLQATRNLTIDYFSFDETAKSKYKQKFIDAISDDLNTPLAIGVIWTLLKEKPSIDIYNLIIDFDKSLGLKLDEGIIDETKDIPEEIESLAKERWEAKKNKDYKLADDLRNTITSKGYNVLDNREGYTIEKIN